MTETPITRDVEREINRIEGRIQQGAMLAESVKKSLPFFENRMPILAQQIKELCAVVEELDGQAH